MDMAGKAYRRVSLLRRLRQVGLVVLIAHVTLVSRVWADAEVKPAQLSLVTGPAGAARPGEVALAPSIVPSLPSDVLVPTPDVTATAGRPSPWPMLQGSAQHTGLSPFLGPSAASLKWRYRVGAPVRLGPVIAGDGTVYVASDSGYVYSLRPDGTLWWRQRVGSSVSASPALASDGTLYVGTDDGNNSALVALSPSGAVQWRFSLGTPSHTPLTVGPDGTIYAGTDAGWLIAIDADGKEQWRFDTMTVPINPRLDSAAAVGPEGTVYVGSGCGYLHAIAPDGSPRWSVFLAMRAIRSGPTVGVDGNIICASDAGCLHVVSPEGKVLAICGGSMPYPCEIVSSPAVGSDGTVYLGLDTTGAGAGFRPGYLGAYLGDGTEQWQVAVGGRVRSSPAIGADGIVYVGADDGILYALNPDGTFLWKYATGDAIESSPALAADGTLYFGSRDGYVYAMGRPPNQAPTNGTVTPYRGSAPAGQVVQFTTTWTDPDSWADLKACYFVLGNHWRPAGNVFLSYDPVANRLYLANDAGTSFLGGLEPGSPGEMANSKVRVLAAETTVVRNGTTVQVTWSLALSAEAPAVKSLYLRCEDRSGQAPLWTIRGSWTVR